MAPRPRKLCRNSGRKNRPENITMFVTITMRLAIVKDRYLNTRRSRSGFSDGELQVDEQHEEEEAHHEQENCRLRAPPPVGPLVRASRRQNRPPAEVRPPAMSSFPGCFDWNSGRTNERQENPDCTDRQVDGEDPSPVDVLHQVAAQRRADGRGHEEGDPEDSHGASELCLGHHPEDHCHGGRHDHAAPHCLDDAGKDQGVHAPRKAAEQGAHDEHPHGQDVEALEPDPVSEPPREGDHDAQGKHVDRVHPLHLGGADVEHVHDGRDGHVDDARVQDGHEGADQRDEDRGDPVRHRPLGHLFAMGRRHRAPWNLCARTDACLLAHSTLSSCSRQWRTLARSPASRSRVTWGRVFNAFSRRRELACIRDLDQLIQLRRALHDDGAAVVRVAVPLQPSALHQSIQHAGECAGRDTELFRQRGHPPFPRLVRLPQHHELRDGQAFFLREGRQALGQLAIDVPQAARSVRCRSRGLPSMFRDAFRPGPYCIRGALFVAAD